MIVSKASQLHLVELGKEYKSLIDSIHSHNRVAVVVPVNDDLGTIESESFQGHKDEEDWNTWRVLHKDVIVMLREEDKGELEDLVDNAKDGIQEIEHFRHLLNDFEKLG